MKVLKDDKRYGKRATLLRAIDIILTASVAIYCFTYIILSSEEALEKSRLVIESILNPTFVKFLNKNYWLITLFFVLLVISLIYKLIAIFRRNDYERPLESATNPVTKICNGTDVVPIYGTRIDFINNNYNSRNSYNIPLLLAALISVCNVKVAEVAYSVGSTTESLISKTLFALILIVCLTSLIKVYNLKIVFLGFDVTPKFVHEIKPLVVAGIVLLSIISLFFVCNLITGFFNVIGVTVGKKNNEINGFMTDGGSFNSKPIVLEVERGYGSEEGSSLFSVGKLNPFRKLDEGEYNRPLDRIVFYKISDLFSGKNKPKTE